MMAGEAVETIQFNIYNQTVNLDTVIVTWLIIVASVVFLLIFKKYLGIIPCKLQTAVELAYEFFEEQADAMMGYEGREFVPIIFFIFITVLTFNWIGLLPSEIKVAGIPIFAPPTKDINTTAALALCTFMVFNYYGFKKKGIRYFLNFIHPAPEVAKSLPVFLIWVVIPLTVLFLILNIIELFARVLSLSIRLFGNVLGEHIVSAALILFTTVVLEIFIAAGILAYLLPLFVFLLGIITGIVQAFIFAMLTLTYISGAVTHYE